MSTRDEAFEAAWCEHATREHASRSSYCRHDFTAGWDAHAAQQEAAVRELVAVLLTPKQIECMADFIINRGDLDKDSHCLSALILRRKANELRVALAKVEGK